MGRQRHRGLAGHLSTRATPRPAWPNGNLVNFGGSAPSPTRKQTLLGQRPSPNLEFTGRKGFQRPLLDSRGLVPTHAHAHTHTSQVGKWRPREDKRLSRDPLYSLSVQISFSENGCKVNL